MLLSSQRLFSYSPPNLCFPRSSSLSLSINLRYHLSNPTHFPILNLTSLKPHNFTSSTDPFHLRAYESDSTLQKDALGEFNLESFLSVAELLCLLSSVVLSVAFGVNSVIGGSKKEFLLVGMGNKVVVWSVLMFLVGGVVIGAWIRRRQWRRMCRETWDKDGLEVNLLERIEKLEEDLKSSVSIVRVLNRQLEKLSIRFRVTRKGLKEPINETAALAQKNSEATRALVAQSDNLEKELGEIQKVLLAMQEQQQKQFDLILAIGKTTKLWEGKRETNEVQNTLEAKSDENQVNKKEFHQI